MSHGKETPRQKMIGMMYLVLMALLALNVSKDVLEAFVIVDHGIVKTTEGFSDKNNIYYDQFDIAAAENPVKAGPWKAKAEEVRRQSNELYNFIQDLKIEIVRAVDGEESEAIDEEHHHVDGNKIKAKDELNKAMEIMIGPNEDGKANDLRSAIEGFREYLLSVIDEEAEEVINSIESNLDTHDPPVTEEHGAMTWQQEYFSHYPMIAVVTLMSKMQADIRNAESDAIRHLYSQIDAGSFKFNYLESVVQAESNYVIRGADYNAQIFIAARDTTQQPVIYLGDFDSIVNDEGMVEYSMKGELGRDYDSLPIRGGRGIYSLTPGSDGFREYRGVISLKRMDGSYTNKPFHGSYRVAPPSLIVSPTKMNVMYQALENPIDVSESGSRAEDISISVNNGTSRGSNGSFIVIPSRLENCIISVYDNAGGTRRKLGDKTFRVDPVPPPEASISGKNKGAISRAELQQSLGVEVKMPDWFQFDTEYKVTGMTFVNRVGVNIQYLEAKNGDFTQAMRDAINGIPGGKYLQFTNITVVGDDGKQQQLPDLSLLKR